MRKLNLEIVSQGSLNQLSEEVPLRDSIIMAQQHDDGIKIIKQNLIKGEEKYKCFQIDPLGVLWFKKRIVVPKDQQL
jgi:hypothetical protein